MKSFFGIANVNQINSGMVTDSLKLHLDFTNTRSYIGSGTIASDLSSTVADTTMHNGVSFITDNLVKTMSFDGTNDYMKIPNTNNIFSPVNSNFSIGVWFKTSSHSSGFGVMVGNYSGTKVPGVLYVGNGKIHGFSRNSSNVGTSFPGSTICNDNNWHYANYIRNGNTFSLYLDSNFETQSTAALGSLTTDSGFVTLGAQNAVAGIANQNPIEQFFNGRIACVQYYNKALNTLEIKQNFNYFRGRFGI
jgi:hypothetical protein